MHPNMHRIYGPDNLHRMSDEELSKTEAAVREFSDEQAITAANTIFKRTGNWLPISPSAIFEFGGSQWEVSEDGSKFLEVVRGIIES